MSQTKRICTYGLLTGWQTAPLVLSSKGATGLKRPPFLFCLLVYKSQCLFWYSVVLRSSTECHKQKGFAPMYNLSCQVYKQNDFWLLNIVLLLVRYMSLWFNILGEKAHVLPWRFRNEILFLFVKLEKSRKSKSNRELKCREESITKGRNLHAPANPLPVAYYSADWNNKKQI